MERELKFRGQRLDNKEFVYGGYFQHTEEDYVIHYIFTFENGAIPVDKNTIGQFIGLKAINNIEIYETDLISLGDDIYNEDGEPNIIEIVYDEETASFRAYDYLYYQGSALAEKWFMDDIILSTTVIGNIYENPELLTDKV